MVTALGRGIGHALHRAQDNAHSVAAITRHFAEENMLESKACDVSIQFIGASGLPRMDVMGLADPYFIATIDKQLRYVSTVQGQTLTPVWNAIWNVKRVPVNAILKVEVMDRDEGMPIDDYIGNFETTISPGPKEVDIVGSLLKAVKGTFWLNITSTPSEDNNNRRYAFDGPIRYTRHNSPTVGRLTHLNDERLYSTWTINIKGVPDIFGDIVQPWNRNYKAAQSIFIGPTSLAVRSGIQAGHKVLYALRTTDGHGTISSKDDVYALLCGGKHAGAHRVKPAVYTYIIAVEDDTFRFSETGAAFFVDFASKHALHSNCAEIVRYSGEFHPRPEGGWDNFSDDIPDDQVNWELVIDNNSGTYSPDMTMLPALKALLEYNFPGFTIYALDHSDAQLELSRQACRAYALAHRGVKQRELQPHVVDGEETLVHQASVKARNDPPPLDM